MRRINEGPFDQSANELTKFAGKIPNFKHGGPDTTEYIATTDTRYPNYADHIFYDHAAREYLVFYVKQGGSIGYQYNELPPKHRATVDKFGSHIKEKVRIKEVINDPYMDKAMTALIDLSYHFAFDLKDDKNAVKVDDWITELDNIRI